MVLLLQQGIKPTLVIIHTIKPLDTQLVLQLARRHEYLFTVEEHSISGGLGSSVAEVLSETGIRIKFKRLGIVNSDLPKSGSQSWLRHRCGLSPQKIAAAVKQSL